MPHHEDDDLAETTQEHLARTRRAQILGSDARTANAHQVGGNHYAGAALQHWDMVTMFDLDYFQGQITKYVMRWDKKNGVEDLKKAKHFLEKYIEEIEAGRIRKGT